MDLIALFEFNLINSNIFFVFFLTNSQTHGSDPCVIVGFIVGSGVISMRPVTVSSSSVLSSSFGSILSNHSPHRSLVFLDHEPRPLRSSEKSSASKTVSTSRCSTVRLSAWLTAALLGGRESINAAVSSIRVILQGPPPMRSSRVTVKEPYALGVLTSLDSITAPVKVSIVVLIFWIDGRGCAFGASLI